MPFHLIYHRFPDQEAISPFAIAINQMAANQHLRLAFPYLTLGYLRELVEVSQSWLLLTDVQAWINSKRSDARAIQAFIVEYRQCIHDYRGLHAKAIIAGNQALVGSANLTVNALIRNDELLVHIEREPLVDDLQGWFDDRWAHTAMVNAEALERSIGELTVASVPSLDQKPMAMPSAGPRIRATLLPASRLDAVPTLATDGKQRVCSKCGRSELETPFYKNRKITWCKEDFDKANREARKKKPERRKKIAAYNNQWLREHPEVAKKASKNYLEKKKQERKAYRDQLYADGWRTITQAGEMLDITRQAASLLFLNGKFGEAMVDEHDTRRRYVRASEIERYAAERKKRDT